MSERTQSKRAMRRSHEPVWLMRRADGSMMMHSQIYQEAESVGKRLRPRLNFWTGLARLIPDFTLFRLRGALYRLAGCRVGKGVVLSGQLRLLGNGDVASRLTIGEGSVFGVGVTLGLDGPITIGKNVAISPDVTMHTATHALGFGSRRMILGITPKPIVIEDGVWVGMNCLILPGVTIGRGAVVSGGAVVTQDVPPNTLVAGNPATVQQNLPFGNR